MHLLSVAHRFLHYNSHLPLGITAGPSVLVNCMVSVISQPSLSVTVTAYYLQGTSRKSSVDAIAPLCNRLGFYLLLPSHRSRCPHSLRTALCYLALSGFDWTWLWLYYTRVDTPISSLTTKLYVPSSNPVLFVPYLFHLFCTYTFLCPPLLSGLSLPLHYQHNLIVFMADSIFQYGWVCYRVHW